MQGILAPKWSCTGNKRRAGFGTWLGQKDSKLSDIPRLRGPVGRS